MWTKAAVVSVVLLAASGTFGGEAAAPTPIERLTPANAVLLVQATNLSELQADFEQSALGETVKTTQLLSYFYTVAGAGAEFAAVLVSGLPADELRACLGDHAGAALLDFADAADARERIPIVVMIEAADPQKLDQVVTGQLQMLSLLGTEITVAERKVGDLAVRDVHLPNGATLAYCFHGKMLVAGTQAGVAALLESAAKGAPTIADDANYKAVRKALDASAGLTAYANVRALMDKSGIAAHPGHQQKLRAVGVAGTQAAGLAIDFHDRQVRERIYLHTTGGKTGLVRLLTAGQPVAPSATRFIPPGFSAVAAMSIRDVGLWDRLRGMLVDIQGPAAGEFIDTMATNLQQKFAIHPKESLLDTFTDEVFVAFDLSQLKSFHGAGREPRPQEIPLLFGARLADAAKLIETSDRIAANEALWEQGIERTIAQHAGTPLATFRTPFNVDIRPSYAIVDNTLLLSLRPEPVAAAIDAWKAKKTFGGAAAHKAAPAHLALEVSDGQVLAALLACIREELPDGVQHLLPDIDRALDTLHGYRADLRAEGQGLTLETRSDLGTVGTILVAAILIDQGHAVVARRVEGDFDTIAVALEEYHKQHKRYPDSLEQLVPNLLPALAGDRFDPKRAYGYQRTQVGDGPDAWVLTSVGPDKQPNIPIEQFDPPAWAARANSQDPQEVAAVKRVVYQFRPELYKDERKNDDEGDLVRMGGKGLTAPATPRPATPKPPAIPQPPAKKETF